MQTYGGPWTLLKLEIVEHYFDYFVKVMKHQTFKLCYIDAFAGSGKVNIKGVSKHAKILKYDNNSPYNKVFIEERGYGYGDD